MNRTPPSLRESQGAPSPDAPPQGAACETNRNGLPGASGTLEAQRARGVTPRVVVLCLLLAALFGCVIPVVDFKLQNTFLGATHLPPGAIAVLLVLLLIVNPLLRGVSRRLALSRNEALTTYIACGFSCLIAGKGGENFWVPNVMASFYLATRENKWLEWLQPALKPWMTPALHADGSLNRQLVEGWYLGVGPGGAIPWSAWAVPVAAWSAVILALHGMLCCLGVLLRAQWAEREALSFPLLRLPLEMTQDMNGRALPPFFKNSGMWIGFGIAASIQLLNGLNLYFPDVPRVPLEIATAPLLSEAPWNQTGPVAVRVWPLAVGISYLLSREISLSLWAFYFFHKFQLLGAYQLGFMPSTMPDPVFTRGFYKGFIAYQQVGAFLAYSALVLWIGREHWHHVLRRALGRERARPDEKMEALSYPVAFWGFVACFAFMVVWTSLAGVRADVALVLWTCYLIVAVALARVVIEGGLILVLPGWAPLGPLSHLIGGGPGAWLAPGSAIPAAFVGGALMTDIRGLSLPAFIHGFKLAHDHKIPARRLLYLIAACLLISLLVSVGTIIRLGYQNGALTMQEWWFKGNGALAPVRTAQEFVRGINDSFALNWAWLGVGSAFTWAIMLLRSRFAWFPLHPIGYIMWAPFPVYTLWFSIFLGWLAKTLLLRFGGNDAYRKMTPAFLGLALGDVSMMLFWIVIDAWQGRTGHQLMPV